jgi:acetyltransferase-like isoleucine patch superfamily enzyme
MPLPWVLKRALLQWFLGYQLHPDARIGLSWVDAVHVELDAKARIGHLNMIRRLDLLRMDAGAEIVSFNWITAIGHNPAQTHDWDGRRLELLLGVGAAVMYFHFIDCTTTVRLGEFTWLAGVRSTIYTHQYTPSELLSTCAPVTVGGYTMLNGNCTIVAGTHIGERCVLAGMSFANGDLLEPLTLYGGTPARALRRLDENGNWFDPAHRQLELD